jgi:hypothetical protein
MGRSYCALRVAQCKVKHYCCFPSVALAGVIPVTVGASSLSTIVPVVSVVDPTGPVIAGDCYSERFIISSIMLLL